MRHALDGGQPDAQASKGAGAFCNSKQIDGFNAGLSLGKQPLDHRHQRLRVCQADIRKAFAEQAAVLSEGA